MKFILTPLLLFVFIGTAQSIDYNLKDGFMAEGYDVVAYFDNTAVKGDTKFQMEYKGANYKFSTVENLKTFQDNPEKYIPKYGGYCAYAIGVNGKKVDIDPKTFEIRNGELLLFYNAWGTNTLKKWKKEGGDDLYLKAEANWNKMIANE
ncbi:YHS domain-containing protein [Aquimarina sp. ERC-38]|uniref:YHS domain-containing (seleno)protein n=1 Tax=Aquimarina sp. ERC-38 TaxID=2949996 RepID=UPI002247E38F|nr:YHS domain-containing (seleno)protein [Aquimarina sp. ERC-38]UZO81592.1 YHS domain-containing protein [Aquimarina sp. ERC-38]